MPKKVEEPKAPEYEGTGYCVRCKATRGFSGTATQASNGTWIAKGPCEKCKTTVCRMLGKNWVPGLIPSSQITEREEELVTASKSGKVLNSGRGAGKMPRKSNPIDDDDFEEF